MRKSAALPSNSTGVSGDSSKLWYSTSTNRDAITRVELAQGGLEVAFPDVTPGAGDVRPDVDRDMTVDHASRNNVGAPTIPNRDWQHRTEGVKRPATG